jgi:mannose-6-phosphate isomerase-like protein (cupin superfamily)
VFGELASHKVPGHRTIGAYALFEVATQPGAGPPPDVHHREDGAFYVLEGEFEFSAGDTTLRVEAGSLLYSPKGTLHAHERTSVRGPAGRW